MTLPEFIEQFDYEGAIVLLEGKRDVNAADQEKLVALGRLLATRTEHTIFRSGNAPGADQFFAEGVAAVGRQRLQVITPYTGHRKKTNQAHETISLHDIPVAEEREVLYQSKSSKQYKNLIDKYVAGEKNRHTIKAAYITRDTIKAIGTQTLRPATFGIFYDDLANPQSGGTGHTMRICQQNNIPILDQSGWFAWLA